MPQPTDSASTTQVTTLSTASARLRRGRGSRLLQESGLLLALIVVVVIFAVTAPNFATAQNLFNVLRTASFVGIIAMGMTFVIVGGEIDISVGANVALTSALLGVLVVDAGWSLPLAIATVLAVGLGVGIGAGWLRAKTNIPSIIVTLGLFLALRGFAQFISDNASRPVTSGLLDFLNGDILNVPVPAVIFSVVFLAAWFTARRTVFGRSVFAVGGNSLASRLAGMNVDRIRIAVFAITGVLAAVVGVLLTAQIGTSSAVLGTGLEFDVIAAVIIGGTSLAGGSGSPLGTLVGVLFVTVIGNALVLYGVNSSLQDVVRGAIVVMAVLLTNVQTGTIRKKE
jgi:ribose/xylose/arabinose/galactoside ABC-type transport system permease subunit